MGWKDTYCNNCSSLVADTEEIFKGTFTTEDWPTNPRYSLLCTSCAQTANASARSTHSWEGVLTSAESLGIVGNLRFPTREQAVRVVEVVDAGLISGVGHPKLGEMCVEAAVCFAMGLPHDDDPPCVSDEIRRFKIQLNDSGSWSSNLARGKGMRRAAVAQLGSAEVGFEVFYRSIVDQTVAFFADPTLYKLELFKAKYPYSFQRLLKWDGQILISSYSACSDIRLEFIDFLEEDQDNTETNLESYIDGILSSYAEMCVQACIACGTMGSEWLDLVPLEESQPII